MEERASSCMRRKPCTLTVGAIATAAMVILLGLHVGRAAAAVAPPPRTGAVPSRRSVVPAVPYAFLLHPAKHASPPFPSARQERVPARQQTAAAGGQQQQQQQQGNNMNHNDHHHSYYYSVVPTSPRSHRRAAASTGDDGGGEGYSSTITKRRRTTMISITSSSSSTHSSRRDFTRAGVQGVIAMAAVGWLLGGGSAAQALVKGNAPPPDLYNRKKQQAGGGDGEGRASNMEEARERGRRKEDELFAEAEAGQGGTAGFQTTPQGDRYKDMKEGDGPVVARGDTLDIRYKALRLGKRSRDGLSGEATTVFSYGYGFEDDDKEGDTLAVTLGTSNIIPALAAGGCGEALDATNMNSLAASFIVPGTKIQDEESCLDLTRVPAPASYAARRRMGRRFDEALIVEVEVVNKQQP